MLAGGVFLDALLYYKYKVAESSKILKLFIHAPLLMRDDVRWYFPGLCGVSETTMWHSHQALWTLSLMFPSSQRVMLVRRWSLHGVVSDGHVFAFYFHYHQQFWYDLPMKQTSQFRLVWPNFVSQCLLIVFHSRHQSTLIPVPTSIRPMWHKGLFLSHFVSRF